MAEIAARMTTQDALREPMVQCSVCGYWLLEAYWETHLQRFHEEKTHEP